MDCWTAHLRLRNSPGILDHVPEAAVLSPLGLLSSWSHCTRLVDEPTESRCAPPLVAQPASEGCLPLMSMAEELSQVRPQTTGAKGI
jgi:hypothetical protein